MPTLTFSKQQIDQYFDATFALEKIDWGKYNDQVLSGVPFIQRQRIPAILHQFYAHCLRHASCMRVHADGEFPARLLRERRPNEPEDVFDYREKIYVAKTKPIFSKVYNSLQKIRKSPDFTIDFDSKKLFPKINEEETLKKYTTENYPYFTSLTNWVFTLMLRKYLIDANAVVFVHPLTYDIPETDYLKPFPDIFDSNNVIDFAEDDYCILNNPKGCIYYPARGDARTGKSMYIITTQNIYRYDQTDSKGNYKEVININHALGILPAFKLKGILIDQAGNQFLYDSKISGMIPDLDEAVREYSDLQAARVLHIYPERWEFTNNECTECKGLGKVKNRNWTETCNCEKEFTCEICKGAGYRNAGPFAKITVRPPSALEAGVGAVPTPPAGIIEKDSDVVRLQNESVNQHLYSALAAINFEFLADVPLAQSGIAKATDREESNNTTHSVAEDIICSMDNIMKITAYWRYKGLYPDVNDLNDMLPSIPVPENFDLLYTANAEKELSDAKTNKFNPVILNAMEVSYTSKRFNTEPELRDTLILILTLDPLPNITQDDKMTMLTNEGITLEDYIISSKIQSFVQRAIDEDKNFPNKDLSEQKKIIQGYAQDQIKAQSNKAKVIPIGSTDNQNPGAQDNNPVNNPSNTGTGTAGNNY